MSTETLNLVAIITGLVITFAFLLRARLFKPKQKHVIPSAQWEASQYYIWLRIHILAAETPDELKKYKIAVEKFYDKQFREHISTRKRKKYYARLLEVVSNKESELLSVVDD